MKTEGGVVLRDFQEADFDSLVKLWTATGIGNPARGDTLECVRATLDHGGRLFVLDKSDVVVGSAWITDDGRRLYLHHMAVLPEFQGRGLSRRLMDAAVALARRTPQAGEAGGSRVQRPGDSPVPEVRVRSAGELPDHDTKKHGLSGFRRQYGLQLSRATSLSYMSSK